MLINYKRYIALLLLCSMVFFFLDKTSFFERIGEFFSINIIQPVTQTTHFVFNGGVRAFESVFLLNSFIEEYENLKKERDFYRGEFLRLKAVEEENVFLRQALQLEQEEETLLLATITSTDQLRPHHQLTINQGSNSGIQKGQTVILSGRVFVGQVQDVRESTSVVRLVTSEESSISATLEGSDINALAQGLPSGALSLELIPRATPINVGEIVLTSGIGSTIPENLLIGGVRKIVSEDTASFQSAVVEPFFSLQTAQQVFVIIE